MKLSFLILFCFVYNIAFTQLLHKRHVPGQPYNQFTIQAEQVPDSVIFYLSEFQPEKKLPLLVFIQGSGNQSLFRKEGDRKVATNYGHITWAYRAQGKVKVLIIEKPGIQYLDNQEVNATFDQRFSLASWVAYAEAAIHFVCRNEIIDSNRILIAGHSEGGLVASRLAARMGSSVSHVAVIAGEGPSQLYSLFRFAETAVFFDRPGFTAADRIDSLSRTWKRILADPLSTEKKFWGFTYLRWSGFLSTSPQEELNRFNGKILILQGDADRNVYPESAHVLYSSLLAKGKEVALQIIEGADHSFANIKRPDINGWEEAAMNCIDWFLADTIKPVLIPIQSISNVIPFYLGSFPFFFRP